MASSSNFSSNVDEILEQLFVNMDTQRQCAFACVVVVTNSFNMFNANELEEGVGQLVDLGMGIRDVLIIVRATPGLFKILTDFTLVEFNELTTLMVATID
jgi:hypothetical protein